MRQALSPSACTPCNTDKHLRDSGLNDDGLGDLTDRFETRAGLYYFALGVLLNNAATMRLTFTRFK